MAGDKTTEDSILEHRDANDGAKNEQPTDEQTTDADTQESQDTSQDNVEGGVDVDGSGKGDSKGKPKQEKEGTDTHAPKSAQPGQLRDDGKGNLVDDKGKVVAKAGTERRLFQEREAATRLNQRQATYIKQLEQGRKELEKRADNTTMLSGAPAKLGLNNEEVQSGLAIFASWKKDPMQTLKYLIDTAKEQGYPVDSVLSGQKPAPSQLDAASVSRLVAQELQKVLGPQQAAQANTQRAQQIRAAADAEYTAFIAKHPHADVHEGVIAKLATAQDMSPEMAYMHLQAYAMQNGLDFTQPLQPQIDARQRATPNKGRTVTKPINGGRGGSQAKSSPMVANADTDMRDIVRQSMADSGFDVSKL